MRVCRILFQLVLQSPTATEKFLPMLDCFHLTKAVEHFLGKFLKGSRVQDALIETNCFGLKILGQTLRGTHYVQLLRGMTII